MEDPIRRSALISTFGIGSLYITKDGTSMIHAGLDHWFQKHNEKQVIKQGKFKLNEWRLQNKLRVKEFYSPAHYIPLQKNKTTNSMEVDNLDIKHPFYKFPQYHYCQNILCERMYEFPLTNTENHIPCKECKKSNMEQVNIIAMCEYGHIQDFPWREWAHKDVNTICEQTLRRKTFPVSGPGALQVVCDCGAKRNVISALGDFSNMLDKNYQYLCEGKKPWLGTGQKEECGRTLTASYKSSTNVYFSKNESAIFLINPKNDSMKGKDSYKALIKLIVDKQEPYTIWNQFYKDLNSTMLKEQERYTDPFYSGEEIYESYKENPQLYINYMKNVFVDELGKYNSEELFECIDNLDAQIFSLENTEFQDMDPNKSKINFYHEEYIELTKPQNQDYLVVSNEGLDKYSNLISKYFENIFLINRLTETIAFKGFQRVHNSETNDDNLKALIKRDPNNKTINWLPAVQTRGEGIFLQFNETILNEWENKQSIKDRLDKLINPTDEKRKIQIQSESKNLYRYVLLHTFSHALIKTLVFSCGYGAASIKERIYTSNSADTNLSMAGILIYTASGTGDGSLGGLVRMGKPEYLEEAIRTALIESEWCSSDPICMDYNFANSEYDYQSNFQSNLAACHNCILLPETSCESFNSLLDRGTIVPQIDIDSGIEYFKEYFQS